MRALSLSLVTTGVLLNAVAQALLKAQLPDLKYCPEHRARYLRALAARQSAG